MRKPRIPRSFNAGFHDPESTAGRMGLPTSHAIMSDCGQRTPNASSKKSITAKLTSPRKIVAVGVTSHEQASALPSMTQGSKRNSYAPLNGFALTGTSVLAITLRWMRSSFAAAFVEGLVESMTALVASISTPAGGNEAHTPEETDENKQKQPIARAILIYNSF